MQEIEYEDRAMYRDGGTTMWRLDDNPLDADVIVNPSPSKARLGDKPEIYSQDDVDLDEYQDIGMWYMMEGRLISDNEVSEGEVTHISNGNQIF